MRKRPTRHVTVTNHSHYEQVNIQGSHARDYQLYLLGLHRQYRLQTGQCSKVQFRCCNALEAFEFCYLMEFKRFCYGGNDEIYINIEPGTHNI